MNDRQLRIICYFMYMILKEVAHIGPDYVRPFGEVYERVEAEVDRTGI